MVGVKPASPKERNLILVGGLAASGKTFIAQHIASHLGLSLISKDRIKELLYDSLEMKGIYDTKWSKKLTTASMLLMYQFAETELALGRSCVIESTFDAKFSTPDILKMRQRCPFNPIQILCYTESAVLVERFKNRAISNTRHPAHLDAETAKDPGYMTRFSTGKADILDIGGQVIEINTTEFEKVNLDSLIKQLSRNIGPVFDEPTEGFEVEPMYTLEQLLAKVTIDNLHHEVDSGPIVGREVE